MTGQLQPQFIHNLYWRHGYPLSFALLFTRFPSPPHSPKTKKISTISSFSKLARSYIPSCTSNLFFCLHDCLRWVNLRAFRREVELPLALTLDALETLTLRWMDRALEKCCQTQKRPYLGNSKIIPDLLYFINLRKNCIVIQRILTKKNKAESHDKENLQALHFSSLRHLWLFGLLGCPMCSLPRSLSSRAVSSRLL